ncbi:hypothetical protein K490DRAFT_57333 [Saccharata proteae CBS 121410]|uniref:F-box domain-containing protein n=1 Tax=Saccharata proteae CBS 121410 TaxID=1314787 RepID=A0A9P4HVK7_9PEZI|nr:hypothetical protein K490DRAFT_57333 [Saccharata proteae CBS 121410]
MHPRNLFHRKRIGERSLESADAPPADLDEPTGINHLPTELVKMIMAPLPQQDLAALAKTSRRLNAIATPALYQTFRPKPPHLVELRLLVRTLTNRPDLCQYVHYVEFATAHELMYAGNNNFTINGQGVVHRQGPLGWPPLPNQEPLFMTFVFEDEQLVHLLSLTDNLKGAKLLPVAHCTSVSYITGRETSFGTGTFDKLTALTLDLNKFGILSPSRARGAILNRLKNLDSYLLIPTLRKLHIIWVHELGIELRDVEMPAERSSNIQDLTLECMSCTDSSLGGSAGGMLNGLPRLLSLFKDLKTFRWLYRAKHVSDKKIWAGPGSTTIIPGIHFHAFPYLLWPVRDTLEHLDISKVNAVERLWYTDNTAAEDLRSCTRIGDMRAFEKLKTLKLPTAAIAGPRFSSESATRHLQVIRALELLPAKLEKLTVQSWSGRHIEPSFRLACLAVHYFSSSRQMTRSEAAHMVEVDSQRWRVISFHENEVPGHPDYLQTYSHCSGHVQVMPFSDAALMKRIAGLRMDELETMSQRDKERVMREHILKFLDGMVLWEE